MIAASRISKAAVVKSRSVARVQSTIVCNQSGGFGKVSSKPKDTSMKLSKKIEKELGIAREATGQLKAKQGVPSASAASQGVDVKKKELGIAREANGQLRACQGVPSASAASLQGLVNSALEEVRQHRHRLDAVPWVELWCPNDGSIVRSVLGALKKTSDPIDLKIYRNVVADGRVYVQFYEGEY
eukprot:gene4533-14699_t